jgi:peptidoglycan/LPS O-acetylase OafA/YrhL
MAQKGHRIEVVDSMRGIAALSVCIFHLTNGNAGFLAASTLKSVASYGWLGVEVFFVISGFVIPYALHNAGYGLGQYGKFLLKRVVRLDPPYLATILFLIPIGYLSAMAPGFQGAKFHVSLPQAILHIAYLNTFFGYEWLNPVFWSLAIELQYYVLVGLLFPLISNRRTLVRFGLFVSLGLLAVLVPAERFVFHWGFLFMFGMLAFHLVGGARGWVFFHIRTLDHHGCRRGRHRYRLCAASWKNAHVLRDNFLFAISYSRSRWNAACEYEYATQFGNVRKANCSLWGLRGHHCSRLSSLLFDRTTRQNLVS